VTNGAGRAIVVVGSSYVLDVWPDTGRGLLQEQIRRRRDAHPTYPRFVVQVETGGRLAAGATFMSLPTADLAATAHVALGVDVDAAKAFIGNRLASRLSLRGTEELAKD